MIVLSQNGIDDIIVSILSNNVNLVIEQSQLLRRLGGGTGGTREPTIQWWCWCRSVAKKEKECGQGDVLERRRQKRAVLLRSRRNPQVKKFLGIELGP